jgi:hypothetical protein
MDDWDIAAILEGGIDCEESRRDEGCVERCSRWHGRWVRVVAQRAQSGWNNGKDAWIIVTIKPAKEP